MRPNLEPTADAVVFKSLSGGANARLAARMTTYPGRARASLHGYFAARRLSAEALDATLRDQFGANVEPFFVSTIVRGLAGSTSDIDVIAVSGEASQGMSTMIFWEGRRIGVKLIDQAKLDAALADLQTAARRISNGAFVSPIELAASANMKRVDLERLINGYSLSLGTCYLDHLPALSAVTALEKLREAAVTLTAAAWAWRSGSLARARAYLTAFTINAMDAVMAENGEVQSNTKWTTERWHVFRSDLAFPSTSEASMLIEQMVVRLASGLEQEVSALIADARAVLAELAAASAGSEHQVLVPAPGVARFAFMPGADCLIGDIGCVIVDGAQLNDLLSVSSLIAFNVKEACLALELVSRSVLRIETVASHDRLPEATR